MSENGHDSNGAANDVEIRLRALTIQIESIRKVCEAGWAHGEPCRLCTRIGRHSDTCYIRTSTGFDLLDEHEATVRENDELRAALAARLPVNGERLLAGSPHLSLRAKMQGRFSRHGTA